MKTLTPRDKTEFHKREQTNKWGYLGVKFNKKSNRFQAYIRRDGRKVYCGQSTTPEGAALLYDTKAIEFFGTDAVTNFESRPA